MPELTEAEMAYLADVRRRLDPVRRYAETQRLAATERRTAAVARVRAYIAAREASAWEPRDFVDREGDAELTLADLIEIVGRDAP
jgi:hypothetical protein